MADHKFPEGPSKIVGPDGKTHYRLNAEPAEIGANMTPLGVAPRPSTEEVRPRFCVTLDFGKGPEHVAIYTPEEILNEANKVFEKKRLLATCLVAQAKQVHTVAAPSGRGEVDALRDKVQALENRPRWRFFFVYDDNVSTEVFEAKTAADALEACRKRHGLEQLPDSFKATEVRIEDLEGLLEDRARLSSETAKLDPEAFKGGR